MQTAGIRPKLFNILKTISNLKINKMKKIFLTAVAVVAISCVAVYADNGKKTVAKKKAKTECCKKQSCCNTINYQGKLFS